MSRGSHAESRRERGDRGRHRRRGQPAVRRQLAAAWLAGIVLSLLLVGGYGDIALRDLGLLVGALALARLAAAPSRVEDRRLTA